MRTYGNLYGAVCSFENLYRAFCQTRRGKLSRFYCAKFAYSRENEILRLQEELQSGGYKHGGYRFFEVFDPKLRQIQAATFKDRVVHHALCNVIEPIFERTFIYDSFACRKGKGTLLALRRCEKLARRFSGGYVLKADISKYFYSVDHKILLGLISAKIRDKKALALCSEIIASSQDSRFRRYFPGDDLFALSRPTGLPIGNLTSQLFSNLYLNELDKFVKHELRWRGYLRYMDDFLLFGAEKPPLHGALRRIEGFLGENLRLVLHPKKRVVLPVKSGLDWVGYRIFPDRTRIRRANIFRFRSRLGGLRAAYHGGSLPLKKIGGCVASFAGYAKWAQSARLLRRLLELETF